MKFLIYALSLLTAAAEPVAVFSAGEAGYASIRIPAVVVANNGDVLAFAEGRAKAADQAQNDIVLKRSSDGGKTWGALQKLADRGAESLNNPTAVVEGKSGRVLLVYQSYASNVHEYGKMATGYDDPAATRCWLQHSDDHGATWSEPRDVTRMMKRETEVTTLASGPGIGIQLQKGPHAGRLLMPFNQGPPGKWKVYTAYSDDGGATWARGETAPEGPRPGHEKEKLTNANEVQVVEIADGKILLNCRRQAKGDNRRLQAVSADGGQTWSDLRLVPELVDGPCMASVLRVDSALLFSGPWQTKRADGVLFHSRDDGATWTRGPALNVGPFAYSVLTRLPDGRLGCLYETGDKGPYERIVFHTFTSAWAMAESK